MARSCVWLWVVGMCVCLRMRIGQFFCIVSRINLIQYILAARVLFGVHRSAVMFKSVLCKWVGGTLDPI